jgi:hypothetical protein
MKRQEYNRWQGSTVFTILGCFGVGSIAALLVGVGSSSIAVEVGVALTQPQGPSKQPADRRLQFTAALHFFKASSNVDHFPPSTICSDIASLYFTEIENSTSWLASASKHPFCTASEISAS